MVQNTFQICPIVKIPKIKVQNLVPLAFLQEHVNFRQMLFGQIFQALIIRFLYPDYTVFLSTPLPLCNMRLLHDNFSNTYLSRYNSDSLDYQCQHMATILWAINATTTGRDLVSYVDRTIAINRSNQNSRKRSQFVCFNETKLLLTLLLKWSFFIN